MIMTTEADATSSGDGDKPRESQLFVTNASICYTTHSAEVEAHVKKTLSQHGDGSELVTLVCSSLVPTSQTTSVLEFFVCLYRSHSLHKNDRESILSADDLLLAVQLCLATMNKEAIGDFAVESSQVLLFHNKLIKHKLDPNEDHVDGIDSEKSHEFLKTYEMFLHSTNMTDWMEVYLKIKAQCSIHESLRRELFSNNILLFGQPTSEIEHAFLVLLSAGRTVSLVSSELSLDQSFSEVAANLDLHIQTVSNLNMNITTPSVSPSHTQLHIERVMVDYIHLLLNSCNELSLARVLNVPDRGLNHRAFTDLKHTASTKAVSMYQTAVSYIMRVRLGGKSYAPDTSSPLMKHLKGLGEFVDFIHKLQTIVEEDSNVSSAVKRVINVVKNQLLKERGARGVDEVTQRLHTRVTRLITTSVTNVTSPARAVSGGGSVVGRPTLRVLRRIVDQHATLPTHRSVDILTDTMSSQSTPVTIQCLMSKFRSPVDLSPLSAKKPLAERIGAKQSKQQKGMRRYGTHYDWAEPQHSACDDTDPAIHKPVPSKSLVHPGKSHILPSTTSIKPFESKQDQENLPTEGCLDNAQNAATKATSLRFPLQKVTEGKGNQGRSIKRKLDLEQASGPNKRPNKAQPKNKTKAKTLQKGQTQVTAYFRL